MKVVFSILMFLFLSTGIYCQSVVGTWKTIDDEDGTEKSHVSIYEKDGLLYGKVLKLINPDFKTCKACKDERKDKPIEGMVIMWDLKKDGDNEWNGGKIIDPKNGKIYKCKIELKDQNTLDVRGYVGVSLFGRTQTWHRVEVK